MNMVRLTLAIITAIVVFAGPVNAEEQLLGGVGLQVVPTIDGDLVVLNVL